MAVLDDVLTETFRRLKVLETIPHAGGDAADTTYNNTTSGLAGIDVQAAIDELAASVGTGSFVPLGGGTMTGDLILDADPTNTLGAATKHYVDAAVAGGGTVGALIGALNNVTTDATSIDTYAADAIGSTTWSDLDFRSANGHVGAPTALGPNDLAGTLRFWGYNGTGWNNMGSARVSSWDTQSTVEKGGFWSWWVAPPGASGPIEAVRAYAGSDGTGSGFYQNVGRMTVGHMDDDPHFVLNVSHLEAGVSLPGVAIAPGGGIKTWIDANLAGSIPQAGYGNPTALSAIQNFSKNTNALPWDPLKTYTTGQVVQWSFDQYSANGPLSAGTTPTGVTDANWTKQQGLSTQFTGAILWGINEDPNWTGETEAISAYSYNRSHVNTRATLGAPLVNTFGMDLKARIEHPVQTARTVTSGATAFGSVLTSADYVASDAGCRITGTGIPAGSRIVSVVPGVSATFSDIFHATTASYDISVIKSNIVSTETVTTTNASATITTATVQDQRDVYSMIAGVGFPINTFITSISGTTVTLSQPCNASGTVTASIQRNTDYPAFRIIASAGGNIGTSTITITGATVDASDVGRLVTGEAIPSSTYIGTVTSSTTFTISSSPNSNVPELLLKNFISPISIGYQDFYRGGVLAMEIGGWQRQNFIQTNGGAGIHLILGGHNDIQTGLLITGAGARWRTAITIPTNTQLTVEAAWSATAAYQLGNRVQDLGILYKCTNPVGPSSTHPASDIDSITGSPPNSVMPGATPQGHWMVYNNQGSVADYAMWVGPTTASNIPSGTAVFSVDMNGNLNISGTANFGGGGSTGGGSPTTMSHSLEFLPTNVTYTGGGTGFTPPWSGGLVFLNGTYTMNFGPTGVAAIDSFGSMFASDSIIASVNGNNLSTVYAFARDSTTIKNIRGDAVAMLNVGSSFVSNAIILGDSAGVADGTFQSILSAGSVGSAVGGAGQISLSKHEGFVAGPVDVRGNANVTALTRMHIYDSTKSLQVDQRTGISATVQRGGVGVNDTITCAAGSTFYPTDVGVTVTGGLIGTPPSIISVANPGDLTGACVATLNTIHSQTANASIAVYATNRTATGTVGTHIGILIDAFVVGSTNWGLFSNSPIYAPNIVLTDGSTNAVSGLGAVILAANNAGVANISRWAGTSPVTAGALVASWWVQGLGTSSSNVTGGKMRFIADDNYTSAHAGTHWDIQLAAVGSTTLNSVFAVDGLGNITLAANIFYTDGTAMNAGATTLMPISSSGNNILRLVRDGSVVTPAAQTLTAISFAGVKDNAHTQVNAGSVGGENDSNAAWGASASPGRVFVKTQVAGGTGQLFAAIFDNLQAVHLGAPTVTSGIVSSASLAVDVNKKTWFAPTTYALGAPTVAPATIDSTGLATVTGLTNLAGTIWPRVTKSSAYTTTNADVIIGVTGTTTITLGTLTTGRWQIITNEGTNTVTVAATTTNNGVTSLAAKASARYYTSGSGVWFNA